MKCVVAFECHQQWVIIDRRKQQAKKYIGEGLSWYNRPVSKFAFSGSIHLDVKDVLKLCFWYQHVYKWNDRFFEVVLNLSNATTRCRTRKSIFAKEVNLLFLEVLKTNSNLTVSFSKLRMFFQPRTFYSTSLANLPECST